MGYYKGDFYRGDYYNGTRGDPGFFSFLGGIAKSALGMIPGVGPGLSAVAGRLGAGSAAGAGMGAMVRQLPQRGVQMIMKHPVLSAAGAAGAVGLGGMELGRAGMVPAGMKGFHMSKPRKGHPSHLVRNRRMRVTNPRALRRAIRRTSGFAKLAMRTIHLVHPRKRGRFGGFKKRRAKRVA